MNLWINLQIWKICEFMNKWMKTSRRSTLFFSSINSFFENGWIDWEENEERELGGPKRMQSK